MPTYDRRFFGETPWFTSSYQSPGYIGADSPSWGKIAAPALEETELGQNLRSLYIANAMLPFLNPYSRNLFINRIVGAQPALKDLPQTGATQGATLEPVVSGYRSAPTVPISSMQWYRSLGPAAEALGAAAGVLSDDDAGYDTPESRWLGDVAQQLQAVSPKADESWTYQQVQDVNGMLQGIAQGAPSDTWAQLVQDMFAPQNSVRQVPVGWYRGQTSSGNWFS